MLAGLSRPGITTVDEPLPTRDHTERAFPAFGLDMSVDRPAGQRARAARRPSRRPAR